MPVERGPQRADDRRQRVVEVAIPALAEAVTGHVDRGAEAAVLEQLGELVALVGGQHRGGRREAALVELPGQLVPVEGVDAVGDRCEGGGHAPWNDPGATRVRSTAIVLNVIAAASRTGP